MRSHPVIAQACSVLLLLATRPAQAQDQWPLMFNAGDYEVQIFTPQPESFDGTLFSARAAVAVRRLDEKQPLFGAIWGNGVLAVDRDSRMGTLTSFTVTDARFPTIADTNEVARLRAVLSTEFPRQAAPIAIDWIEAALEHETHQDQSYVNDPPTIIYRETPSVLVFIDGDPIYEAVKTTGSDGSDPVYASTYAPQVERVVNTPFLMVRPKGGDHYLYGSGLWFRAHSIEGTWVQASEAPEALANIARNVDGTAALTPSEGSARIPAIVVTTVPAELVSLDGPPQLKPVPKTSLLYATNTTADLFLDLSTQDYYLLASGRWYATRDPKNGPWRYVPANVLPAAFAQIPEGSDKDDALAHIAGTRPAQEAVRDASIPQTASVDRHTATLNVTYNGDPRFEQVEGTEVYQGVNASTTVMRINGRFHACDNAVWFESGTPFGPWTVSTEVPPEVNTIPASSALYNVRYVYIYDHTPDVVFTGYTPGYLGCYVQGGAVIYGTGYYYDPWPGYWYPRPFTWGFNMYYDPWVGWGWGLGWGFNWWYPGWWGYGYYPYYGYGGCGWWGPYGYYPPVHYHEGGCYYGHRPAQGGRPPVPPPGPPGGNGAFSRTTNLYASRTGQGVKPTTVGTGGAATKPKPTTTGKPGMKPIANDHFTDAQGNVFRRDGNSIQRYEGGHWSRVPANTKPGSDPRPNTITAPQDQGRLKPGTRPNTPAIQQQRTPQRIQMDRERGQQRVFDRNNSNQQRGQPPPTRSSPNYAPSRGGGGGGGKHR